MRMKSIYSPREFGLLVGRMTKTYKDGTVKELSKCNARLQKGVIIPTISISRLLKKKQKTVDLLLIAEYPALYQHSNCGCANVGQKKDLIP